MLKQELDMDIEMKTIFSGNSIDVQYLKQLSAYYPLHLQKKNDYFLIAKKVEFWKK
jgi:hypothetical protein